MKPSEILTAEHVVIKRGLQVLKSVCDQLEQKQSIPAEHIKHLTEFIIVYADKHHHMKEEDIFFREMARVGFPMQGGPVGVMLYEHNVGRDHVQKIMGAIPGYESGEKADAAIILNNGLGFINLLTQHIHKEDTILYPMADSRLAAEQQQLMLEEFDQVEKKNNSHGEIDAILNRLKVLEQTYIKF